jgi:hypothetical protein
VIFLVLYVKGDLSIFEIMKIFLIPFFILFSSHAFAQQCICKHDGYIDSEAFDVEALDAYTFKNGNSLKICPSIRYYFDNDTTKYFNDFALKRCNNDSIIFVGESSSRYLIHQIKDSLILKEVFDLPTGTNRKLERVVLSMITITTKGEKFTVNKEFNAIRKYTAQEIALTLKEYEKSNKNFS